MSHRVRAILGVLTAAAFPCPKTRRPLGGRGHTTGARRDSVSRRVPFQLREQSYRLQITA